MFLSLFYKRKVKFAKFAHNTFMVLLVKIVLAVYVIAVNVYAFFLIKTKHAEDDEDKSYDGKFFITGILGGALGIYVSMFIYKYRLQSLFLMTIMPVLIAVNIYVIIKLFLNNFGIILPAQEGCLNDLFFNLISIIK